MEKLIAAVFGSPWWLLVGATVYGISWSVYRDLWRKDAGRGCERWCLRLRRNWWLRIYRMRLRRALDRLDRWLDPGLEPRRWPAPEVQRAWSGPLLDWCLLLAVVYPTLLLIVQWAVTNEAAQVDGLTLLEGEQPLLTRVAALGGLVGGAIGLRYSGRLEPRERRFVPALLSAGVLVAAATAFAAASAARQPDALQGVFGFSAIVGAAGAFAATGAFAVAAAFAFAAKGAVAVAFAATGPGAFAAAGAGAFAAAVALRRLGRWYSRPAGALLLNTLALLGCLLILVAYFEPEPKQVAEHTSLLIFLGVLPILNALADFASVGLTRYLLRRSLRDGARWHLEWVWDALGGLAILVALGFALIAVGHLARFPDGTPVLDVAGLLNGIRDEPGRYWWLYLGIASTLLPTLAHLAIGSFGFTLMAWPWLRHHIADGLEAGANGDPVRGRWAVQWLCLGMTATVLLPLVLLGHAIEHHAAIGGAFLELFREFAILIGVEGLDPPLTPAGPPPPG